MSDITPEQASFYAAYDSRLPNEQLPFKEAVERLGKLIAEGTLVRVGENGNYVYRNPYEAAHANDNDATMHAVAAMGPEVRDNIFCDVGPKQIHPGAHVTASLVISSTIHDRANVNRAWIEDSVVHKEARVESGSALTGVSLGKKSEVHGANIQNYIIEEQVSIGQGACLEGGAPNEGHTIGAGTAIRAKAIVASSSFGKDSRVGERAEVRISEFGANAQIDAHVTIRASKFGDSVVISRNDTVNREFQVEDTELGDRTEVTSAILKGVKGGNRNRMQHSHTVITDVEMGDGNYIYGSELSAATLGDSTDIQGCKLRSVKVEDNSKLHNVHGTTDKRLINGNMANANLALVGKTPIYTPRTA